MRTKIEELLLGNTVTLPTAHLALFLAAVKKEEACMSFSFEYPEDEKVKIKMTNININRNERD